MIFHKTMKLLLCQQKSLPLKSRNRKLLLKIFKRKLLAEILSRLCKKFLSIKTLFLNIRMKCNQGRTARINMASVQNIIDSIKDIPDTYKVLFQITNDDDIISA